MDKYLILWRKSSEKENEEPSLTENHSKAAESQIHEIYPNVEPSLHLPEAEASLVSKSKLKALLHRTYRN